MSLLNLTRMRSFSFSVVAFLILTVVSGNAALDSHGDLHKTSRLSMTTSLLPDQLQAMPTNCLPDGNEPNDNPSQATLVSSGSAQGNFHTASDVDWFRYTATGGGWYRIYIRTSHIPYELKVYNQATSQLVASGEAGRDTSIAGEVATYFIEMYWSAPPNITYLIEVVYPTQAVGLHACGSSIYSMTISDLTNQQMAETYQLLGMVYQDSNWSGMWQTEEPPISAVTVKVRRAGGAVVATQQTGSDGIFRFNGLAPGLYMVEETDPSGYVSTTSNRLVVPLFNDNVVYFGDYDLPARGSLLFLPLQLKQQGQ